MPSNPPMIVAEVEPIIAPEVPKPRSTRVIIRSVLTMDWLMIIRLFGCIFSVPTKAAEAALTKPLPKMENEAIWMSCAIAGRLNTLVAKKSERKSEVNESIVPIAISNINPEIMTLLISVFRSSALYCAVNHIIAEFMPQFLNIAMRLGAVNATVYKPYSSEPSSRAMNIVPTAEITVEKTNPQRKFKLPLAETWAISTALLICINLHYDITIKMKQVLFMFKISSP